MIDERIASDTAHTVRQPWAAASTCLAFAALALGLVFHAEVVGAVRVWYESDAYNHGFLLVPVAAYLAWQRRGMALAQTPRPEPRALLLLLPLTLMWLVAAMLSILEVQQFVVVAMFDVVVLTILGWRAFRVMLAPLAYLFLLVPTGDFLIPPLQDFTASFVVSGLKLVGIPVFSDGRLIMIPAGDFVIAEACAGLRFLMASVAFGVFFAAIMYRSVWRKLAFLALSLAVPIVANGFRAFGILVLAQFTGSTTAVMADHIIYGWVFFTLVTLLLIAIGMAFADADTSATTAAPPLAAPATGALGGFALAAVASLIIAGAGPAYAQILDWRSAAIDLARAPAPWMTAAWAASPPAPNDWAPLVANPDHAFRETFSDGQNRVMRFVALYATGGLHNNLVRSVNTIAPEPRWHQASAYPTSVTIAGTTTTLQASEIEDSQRRLLVWQFYVVGGRIVSSPLAAKLTQLKGLVAGGSGISAYVAIAVPAGRDAAAVLARFVGDMAPLGDYLRSLN